MKVLCDRMESELLLNRSGIVSDLIADAPTGASCDSCGLPLHAAGRLMKIPELPGYHCSVLCAEQAIYERGCRWCGEVFKGAHGAVQYCSESCRRNASANRFGNGRRLQAWLRKVSPAHGFASVPGPRCQHCGASLDGQRQGARFCDATCRVACRREK